jgi:hypothetical protein
LAVIREIISERLYRFLMSAYPSDFQQRFSLEMAQVYQSLCQQVYQQSGMPGLLRLWLATIWDWAGSTMIQWWQTLSKRRLSIMESNPINKTDGTIPSTTWQTLLAIIPFMLFGVASLVGHLESLRTYPTNLPLWQVFLISPYLYFYWIILLGLAVSITAGFPRWAFSYLGWAVLFAFWWSNISFYGYRFQAWLPLLVIITVSLLIRRSFRPLRAFFNGLWWDFTLLPFGLFLMFEWVFMFADENHNPYLPLFIIGNTMAACLGAWGFFRSTSPLRRVLALVGGFSLTMIIGAVYNATWDFAAYYGLPEGSQEINIIGLLVWTTLLGIALGLGWLTHWRQTKSKVA